MDKKRKQIVLIRCGIKQVLKADDIRMLKYSLEKRIEACRKYGFKYVARRYEYIKRVLLGKD